jgi:hypothetical protein
VTLFGVISFFFSELSDLPFILMAMISVSSRWSSIGTHFSISTDILNTFRSDSLENGDRLVYVLAEWLRNSPDVCTWRDVVIAVSSTVGGNNPAQAYKIGREYQGN